MHSLRIILLVFLFAFSTQLGAQQTLKGKVYEAVTDSVMPAVNILNSNTKISTRSGTDGTYSIAAAEGDIIIFSTSGYQPDTITVRFDYLLTQYDATMLRRVIVLQGVKIAANYQADSLNRRNYYNHIYEAKAGIRSPNRPMDGVGVTLSPVSFFSKESKQTRTLRKRLEKEERENFIDHSFPLSWVKSLTGLSGDSLSLFMYRYRPSYSFCRKTGREGMLLYVNAKLKEFRKPGKAN